ncbi:3-dehydroquinate synthase [Chamaesiphon minutus]|uniref:3-dehydroquinate synthase n=1 Tax=Chamaesiphon minutus (strain ATCC 27169 / PCC 6605) TaxID=1173020 RepID=K9UK37_CHAP6|nr:3-dehydroquinate synthase [Chamaesiphon minutus]AFY95185.1 3-dehydroquinate synthase [Chamaesiphon minutus PCC 6605]
MESIEVALAEHSYQISIATGNLERLGEHCRALKLGQKVMVVSNPTVFGLYGERAMAALKQANFEVSHCILPEGEQYKTLASIEQIYDLALEHGLERSSTLVALGGGVIGDMTGFAAATWLRGINVVQVPTTLLAMVDSSIGGKTGVNHPKGKNLIGAFHQPRLVVTDPQVLATLPEREFRAGMAEVIKYGIIGDRELFDRLERATSLRQQDIDPELLSTILTSSATAKAIVVSKDEHEQTGLRATLNYGHTIGHAIESATKYVVVNHGEAVAIGMVAAGRIAVALKLWTAAEAQRQDAVIDKANLTLDLPSNIDLDQIVTTLKSDKKVKAGKGVFILPSGIGDTQTIAYEPTSTAVNVVSDPLIKQVLTAMLPIAAT